MNILFNSRVTHIKIVISPIRHKMTPEQDEIPSQFYEFSNQK